MNNFLHLVVECSRLKDRQGVSVRVKMQVQPFDNPYVICNAIDVSNVTRKC